MRGLISALLIGAFVLALGHARQLRAAMSRLLAARSVCDGLSTACFIAALAHMQLANLAAVLQIGPLLITALSVVFYRETVGWRRWTAIGVGFFGALLVIKPIPSAFDIWAIVAAGSALFAALRETAEPADRPRRADPGDRVLGRGRHHAVRRAVRVRPRNGGCSSSATWSSCSSPRCSSGIAIYLMALGFRDVDLSVVAPFRYSYLLTSALGGYLVFSELPDGWTVVGRRPDRGQRHLHAASRGGAAAHAHRQGATAAALRPRANAARDRPAHGRRRLRPSFN